MSLRLISLPCVALLSVITSSFVTAQEKVYVSDILVVNFRTGQGNEYRIDKRLKSNTELTQLEVSEDNNWAKVRHADGTEGWVLTQYLQKRPTAKIQLNQALTKLARLEQQVKTLTEENTSLKSENTSVKAEASSSSQSNESLAAELKKIKAISASAIELDKRHQELLEKHHIIQTERDTLRAENESLINDQRLSFLIYGAGILIAGMIIAVILPSLKPKKRYSEWT